MFPYWEKTSLTVFDITKDARKNSLSMDQLQAGSRKVLRYRCLYCYVIAGKEWVFITVVVMC